MSRRFVPDLYLDGGDGRGDFPRVLELMADMWCFLGRDGRPCEAGRLRSCIESHARRVEGAADIQEIRVFGDWRIAF